MSTAEWNAGGDVPYAEPGWPGEPSAEPVDPDDQLEAELRFRRLVREEAGKLRVRDAANRLVRAERAGAGVPPEAVTLVDFLAVPDQAARYRIDEIWPVGGRVVLTAQYKAGKSTAVGNLARSLADGQKFLGRYGVHRPDGNIVLVDNELDERTLRRWLRAQRVSNADKVAVLPLRGRTATFDLLDDDTRSRWAKHLREAGAAVVILDCLRPVLDALGLDENRDAGRFLVAFDALLDAAGVPEALVVHHMGHHGERSRGDSRILDWPDATWRLVREAGEDGEPAADGRRYFAAYGRDVDVPEGLLDYDPNSRRLTLTGGNRRETAADRVIPEILKYLAEFPDSSGRGIEDALTPPHRRAALRLALRRAVGTGLVLTAPGEKRAVLHRLAPPPQPCLEFEDDAPQTA